ncbi:MAG TPA: hypothetical protein VF070_27580 [Streptosporangiaceae bacterium]
MNGPVERVSATKRITVSAHQVFLAVTDPACHVKTDGSGMLRNAGGARRLKAPGDTFDIEMDRQPLGDLAGLGSQPRYYTIRNTVTRIVLDRLVEWAPALAGKAPSGRVYGWQIQPAGDTTCDVTNYCDWHAISDELRARFTWPVVPASALERSIENLARMLTQA